MPNADMKIFEPTNSKFSFFQISSFSKKFPLLSWLSANQEDQTSNSEREYERERERERVHLCDRVEACVHQHHHHHHHRRRRRLRRLRLRRFRRHLFKASVDGFQISPTPPPFPLTFLGSIAKATVLNQFLKKKEREGGSWTILQEPKSLSQWKREREISSAIVSLLDWRVFEKLKMKRRGIFFSSPSLPPPSTCCREGGREGGTVEGKVKILEWRRAAGINWHQLSIPFFVRQNLVE